MDRAIARRCAFSTRSGASSRRIHEHLRLIERVEALPENQDGADERVTFAPARKLLDFHRDARRV